MTEEFRVIEEIPARTFVVGDIHACLAELELLLKHLETKEKLGDSDQLIFVGDYVDRGPDAKGVVECLINLKKRLPKTLFLKGNHEDMFLNFLGFEGLMGSSYLVNGGAETLASYGCSARSSAAACLEHIPPDHLEFYQSLERMIVLGDFVMVHAGLNPLRDLTGQLDEDLYWIRDEFISNQHFFEKLVVFGHTPYQDVMLHYPFKMGIDTGLVYGNMLSCIEITEGKVLQIEREGKSVKSKALKLHKAEWTASPFSGANASE